MNNTQIKKQQQSGFTLLEVCITMAIVGILSAIAIPSYLSWKPGYQLRDAVSQVRGDLNRAKMRAVETRKQCQIVFAAGGGTYQLNDGNRMMNSNNWSPFRNRSLPEGPYIVGNNVTVTVTFSPRGTATPQTISIKHQDDVPAGADAATITTWISGGIKTTWL